MTNYSQSADISALLDSAIEIVILQADNPDADSLASSLALEELLGNLGKRVRLYCGVDIPGYLRYLPGWDRVSRELPKQFNASIVVDASTLTLFEQLQVRGQKSWVAARPCIVLDHHATVGNLIDFATVSLFDDSASSTSELVFRLAHDLHWTITPAAGAFMMTGILADTQGLANDLASADTYRAMAELVDLGVNRPLLEEQRREYNRMPEEIFRYKAKLIERTEFAAHGQIAHVSVPQTEINTYSPLYNPVPLIQNDLLIVAGVCLSIVFKYYDDGKITAAIRGNVGYPVADKLAEHFGGGGHPYASGFKVEHGRPFNEIKSECLAFAAELLNNLNTEKDSTNETLQHAH